ncbi:Dihydrolipoamide dehydrogenase [Methylophilales bacterium HTCC2181]|uniref:Dihydrolipoyl dehydrogenase n=1 Tax=Methylophilales bacterium HTCC2181 TaxID=383631 RepID=A0P661_9PROT|nr:Dihydrolipoamide dehydrogenase [Methylophilales bacterium HTCC2181]
MSEGFYCNIMANSITVEIPDIGNFDSVDIIEILVKAGDTINKEDPIITVESDKASMDIPSPADGIVAKILIKVGDTVKQGSPIIELSSTEEKVDQPPKEKPIAAEKSVAEKSAEKAEVINVHASDLNCDVAVLGSGPGGYTAAFRAADLGKSVILIERYSTIGGVCLNVGCIPSKALLHTAKVITDAEDTGSHGVTFTKPEIDIEKLRDWKSNKVVKKLTMGLTQMAKQRGVQVIEGQGQFISANQISVTAKDGLQTIVGFQSAIIAAGSQPTKIPGTPVDDRIMDSTGALELKDIPKKLLIIGGGIIGLEMGTVYDALGSKVSLVELTDGLIQGCDRDMVRPLHKRMAKRFENIWLATKVSKMEAKKEGILVYFEGADAPKEALFDRVLVAVGRKPNGLNVGADKAGVAVDSQGFIATDKQMRTNINHIYAIGDIIGQPMLAHKATHEGKIAAEVIAGEKVEFQAMAIPSVAYTDPELAWAGITEEEAREKNIEIEKAVFPWAASGRAISTNRTEGMTKLIFDKKTDRIIGAAIVGTNAGELIAETVLSIEMGADAHDIGLSIHPHPTLSESIAMASEMKEGTITDLYIKKR